MAPMSAPASRASPETRICRGSSSEATRSIDPRAIPCKKPRLKDGSPRGSMQRSNYLFTSESVSEGHPDKVCDRISDEVVDAFYREGAREGLDPWSIRAACETMATTNRVIIAGESRGPTDVTVAAIEAITRKAIKDIGYEQKGFHWANCNIEVLL